MRRRARQVVVPEHGERLEPRARARGRELRAGVQQHQLALRQASVGSVPAEQARLLSIVEFSRASPGKTSEEKMGWLLDQLSETGALSPEQTAKLQVTDERDSAEMAQRLREIAGGKLSKEDEEAQRVKREADEKARAEKEKKEEEEAEKKRKREEETEKAAKKKPKVKKERPRADATPTAVREKALATPGGVVRRWCRTTDPRCRHDGSVVRHPEVCRDDSGVVRHLQVSCDSGVVRHAQVSCDTGQRVYSL